MPYDAPAAPKSVRPPPRRRWLEFGRRWLVVYVILYLVPFPLDHVPVVDALVAELGAPWNALVAWVGSLLGVEAVPRFSGSGDTMFHWVSAMCLAIVTTLVALIGQVRGRDVPGRVLDRARAYARLYLGATMLVYGWSKLIPAQFPAPGPDRFIVPYGDSSPMGLLWTFMGASAGYEMWTGLVEVVAGALLFWRRSALLGASLTAVALGNVVALNFFHDVPVKLFSSHLLLLTLFVLAPDVRRLLDVLWFHRPVAPRELDPFPIARRGVRRAVTAGKLALLAMMMLLPAIQGIAFLTEHGRWAPTGPLHGVYRVESFTRGGAIEPRDEVRWLRIGVNQTGVGAIQRADGSGRRYGLQIDEERRTLTWTTRGEAQPLVTSYELVEPDRLKLIGILEDAPLVVWLRKQPDEFLLTSRGFRWVQEYPFNR